MSDLDALLAGIVANPHEAVRWLIVADWLDDHGFADRAELLRLHRMLIDTCCEPDQHPERAAWQARIVELIDQGVKPCVPQHTLMLPGGVPLVGNFIPPGSFLMGSEERAEERPVHKETIVAGFFLGIYPVTQAQWRTVMATDPGYFKGDTLPVETVTWEDAVCFCGKVLELTGVPLRLPTEAEWEYACRAGTTTRFHYGDVPSADRMNYDSSQKYFGTPAKKARKRTTAVGSFRPNPWGLHDCLGNVSEWCHDGYAEQYPLPSNGIGTTEPVAGRVFRGVRGGAFYHYATICRASNSGRHESSNRREYLGFRVAFTLT